MENFIKKRKGTTVRDNREINEKHKELMPEENEKLAGEQSQYTVSGMRNIFVRIKENTKY